MSDYENFEEMKGDLLDGVKGRKRVFLEQMMDQGHKVNGTQGAMAEQVQLFGESTSTGSTTTSDITRYDRLFMPLMRRVMPSLFAVELCGLQPLDGPRGNIRTIKKEYSRSVLDTAGGSNLVTAGDEASAQNVYDKYSLINSTDEYDSVDAMDPFDQTVNLEGDRGNPMKLEVIMKQVETVNRKLSAAYSLEAEDDADSLDNLSMESEMIATLSDQVRRDMDVEVLTRMKGLAGTVRSLDFANVDGRYAGEKLSAMTISIDEISAEISRKTKIGGASWIVASPRIIVGLKNASNSGYMPNQEHGYNVSASAMVGTYNGLPVYVDNASESDYYLLGHKSSDQDTGLIYSPYIGLASSGLIVNPETFDKRMGIRTRYALTDFTDPTTDLAHSPDFFGRATVANLTLGFTS